MDMIACGHEFFDFVSSWSWSLYSWSFLGMVLISWESLLNWSPNFNAFVGVFKDIAELPDIDSDVRPSPLGDREEEEYI